MTASRIGRRPLSVLAAVVLIGAAGFANAGGTGEVCATSYDTSQDLRDARKLILARAELVACETACPPVLAADCHRWRADVEARIASIVPSARDARGAAVRGTRVFVDGDGATHEEGQPIDIDPGVHTFRFEHPTKAPITLRVEVREGVKQQPVVAVFPADAVAPPPDRPSPPISPPPRSSGQRTAAILLGGFGLAALLVGGALAIEGHVARSALYDCKPNCDSSKVDAVRTTWWIAGGVAAGGALAIGAAFLLWPRSSAPTVRGATVAF